MPRLSEWSWWAGGVGEYTYDIAEEATREDVIRAACRSLAPGDRFQIVEARTWERNTDPPNPDHVPFARTRNHEILTLGPQS